MRKFKCLTKVKEWVKVELCGKVHHFTTFKEALTSPILGHLMTKEYYEQHYIEIKNGNTDENTP
jgi:hypothetical protein